ncbi:MAG: MarR family transcriptional regulator [Paracoccaceae bacterium]
MTEENTAGVVFAVMTEIGIIAQLSRTALESRLPDELIAPHFTVLNHLVRVRDGQTPMAMANAFQTPKTSMAYTLKILEKRGLIEMRPNPEDGRSKCVWLTDAGRALREDTIAKVGPDFAAVVQSFGLDRFVEMLPHLRAFRILLDENRDETGISNESEMP